VGAEADLAGENAGGEGFEFEYVVAAAGLDGGFAGDRAERFVAYASRSRTPPISRVRHSS
jgi:hypothetical protein